MDSQFSITGQQSTDKIYRAGIGVMSEEADVEIHTSAQQTVQETLTEYPLCDRYTSMNRNLKITSYALKLVCGFLDT